MKKLSLLLLVAVFTIVATLTFVACDNNSGSTPEPNAKGVSATIIFADEDSNILLEKTFNTESAFLSDAVEELIADSANELACDSSDSGYGLYMNSFTISGATYPQKDKAYVMMYTSLTDAKLITAGFELTLADTTYNSCGLGMSSMPIEEGVTYVLIAQVSNY